MITAGDIIVAPPAAHTPEFEKTVVLITDHTARGTMGLILNRATEITVNELLTPMNISLPWTHELYWGGPMAQDMVFMLHSSEWSIENCTHRINRNWSYTTHWSMFHHLSDNDEPQAWRIFAGCAAWAPHQLVQEITDPRADRSWLPLVNPPPGELLELNSDSLWSWAMSRATEQAVSSLLV